MSRLILYSVAVLFTAGRLSAQTGLSLEEYKAKVLDYNQNVKTAQQTVEVAKAAAKEIKTVYFPQVKGKASYSYDFNPPTLELAGIGIELKPPTWSAGGQLTQNIYTGGKLSASYHAAKIQQDIAVLLEDLSTDNISYVAEVAYWNAVGTKSLWDASVSYQNILKDLYGIVLTRYDDGYISKTDVLKIETSLKEAEFQVSKARQAYGNNCIALNVLMGAPSGQPLQLTDTLRQANPIIAPVSYDDVLDRRPDYLAAGKQIDLQMQKAKIDRSEYIPKAYIGGSIDYGTMLLNLNNDYIWSPRVFAGISVPIFYWGKSRHTRNRNQALINTMELEQSAKADEIRKEFDISLNNMKETDNQINIARENLDVAQQSLDLNTFSYTEGRISLLDVQSAQLAWLQAYINLIQSYLSNKVSVASYKKVVSE